LVACLAVTSTHRLPNACAIKAHIYVFPSASSILSSKEWNDEAASAGAGGTGERVAREPLIRPRR
jgi:hypothetical protein